MQPKENVIISQSPLPSQVYQKKKKIHVKLLSSKYFLLLFSKPYGAPNAYKKMQPREKMVSRSPLGKKNPDKIILFLVSYYSWLSSRL